MNARAMLPFVRPLVSVLLTWMAARGGLEVSADEMQAATERVAEIVVNIVSGLLALFFVFNNGLRPLFYRKLGEVRPGEVPPAKHDLELAKDTVERAHAKMAIPQDVPNQPHEWKEGDPDEGKV